MGGHPGGHPHDRPAPLGDGHASPDRPLDHRRRLRRLAPPTAPTGDRAPRRSGRRTAPAAPMTDRWRPEELVPCPTCEGTGKVVPNDALAADLRERRLERRVSVAEIARRMDLSANYLS